MAGILVLYGTTDGQTARIAERIGEAVRTCGIDAAVVNASERSPRPHDYDGVIVAASMHAGGFQRPVRRWVRTHVSELNAKPTAFVCVCLSVLQKEPKVQQDLAGIIDRFLTGVGWQPTIIKKVAGALFYTRYNPLKRWVMRRIVRAAGGDTDTSRDYEYTDWNDVREFAETFAGLFRRRRFGHAVAGRVTAENGPGGHAQQIELEGVHDSSIGSFERFNGAA